MRRYLILSFLFAATQGAQAVETGDTLTRSIDNVVVTGARYATDVRHLPMTVSVVGHDRLEATHRMNMLPTLGEEVPGMFITQRSMLGFGVSTGAAGGINMRGLGSGGGRLVVLIDGHPQYQGIFGHAISDAYQTLMTERVEVLRGPASVLYGSNAMGGVVNIVTRRMTADGVKTDLSAAAGSYGTVQTEFTNRIRHGKFYSILAGQYARTDNNRPRMDFEQYGGYVKLGYDFSPNWTAYADIDITHFNASYPGTVQTPIYGARQWITRGVATAVVENHYARTSGALSVWHNFGRHKINDGYEDGEEPQTSYFRSNDALTGVSWYQSATFFSGNRITVGVDYQHIYGKAWNRVMATGEDLQPTVNRHMNEIAGYVDFRQDLLSWLTVDAGVRLDHHSQTGTQWIPQGGLVFRPSGTGELKAMVGKGFRTPTMRELFMYGSKNPELNPESIVNYELSWRQSLADNNFSYGLNLYHIKGDNIIQTQMVDGRRLNVNTGAIENTGAEAEWWWRISPSLSLNNNYSLLHMHNKVVGAPRFKTWLGADYAAGRWTLNGGLMYINGLYTQVGDAETQESFVMLNVNVGFRMSRGLTAWVKGENLFAQKYEINYGYPMPRATFMAGINVKL